MQIYFRINDFIWKYSTDFILNSEMSLQVQISWTDMPFLHFRADIPTYFL